MSAQPISTGAQLAENGRVLATLDDWRAIMFVLVGVILILILLIIWDRWANFRRDTKLALALDKVGDSLDALTIEIKVGRALQMRGGDAPPG